MIRGKRIRAVRSHAGIGTRRLAGHDMGDSDHGAGVRVMNPPGQPGIVEDRPVVVGPTADHLADGGFALGRRPQACQGVLHHRSARSPVAEVTVSLRVVQSGGGQQRPGAHRAARRGVLRQSHDHLAGGRIRQGGQGAELTVAREANSLGGERRARVTSEDRIPLHAGIILGQLP
jgi:hypothetical protein